MFDLTKELLYRVATRARVLDTLFEAIFEQGGVLCDMSQGPLEKERKVSQYSLGIRVKV